MIKDLKKGFTLIELLVVVAIIAILALIVLLALNPVEMARRSRDSRRLSDIGTIRRAIDLALAEDKQTLTDITATGPIVINGKDVTNFDDNGLDISKHLSAVPHDPVNDGTANSTQVVLTDCSAGTAAKNSMVYEYVSNGDTYVLRTRLESADNCDALNTDGNPSDYYEIGTDPGLDLIP